MPFVAGFLTKRETKVKPISLLLQPIPLLVGTAATIGKRLTGIAKSKDPRIVLLRTKLETT